MIYTFNSDLKKRLVAFSKKYPGLCRMTVDDADFGSVTYANRKSRVSIRLVAPHSVERRRAASEYAKKMEYTRNGKLTEPIYSRFESFSGRFEQDVVYTKYGECYTVFWIFIADERRIPNACKMHSFNVDGSK